ncbi:uncharacterized protein N7473_005709 [Penicillium subrubescens]|uniref:SPT2 chromatin protein n=1 Tax=Penicillium subrubescens TaxID=1316194 RepID=A0A1Q5SV72_9EURO|nr:uncharacterized protein N7473_005709 [Penicillium subrubescens]KAJ5896310.1 hypothetical protein N7473_005709 [Penicillium subrubescens]OKO91860.1 hypothetical protein PENSUB_12933 [Penicillium subrubescens]
MSFLDSVLSSLQSGKPTQAPLSQPPAIPTSSSTVKKDDRRVGAAPRAPPAGNASTGIKRKAEDQLPRPSRPESQQASKVLSSRPAASSAPSKVIPGAVSSATVKSASLNPVPRSSTTPTSTAPPARAAPPKPTVAKPTVTRPTASKPVVATTTAAKPAATKPAPVSSKPPPKGSFADLMKQAKAMQDKAPAQLGMLRHQKVSKERLSKVERKRRLEEAKAQEKAARSGKRPAPGPATAGKPTVKRRTPEPLSYKGTAKPAPTPEPAGYRGTAGRQSHRGTTDRRPNGKRRMDEYLATDEEDESDFGDYGDYDNLYSDASSDMEAGFDDMREEEDAALRSARKEDEEEMRAEMAAKQQKLERQKKLAALASRTKR